MSSILNVYLFDSLFFKLVLSDNLGISVVAVVVAKYYLFWLDTLDLVAITDVLANFFEICFFLAFLNMLLRTFKLILNCYYYLNS